MAGLSAAHELAERGFDGHRLRAQARSAARRAASRSRHRRRRTQRPARRARLPLLPRLLPPRPRHDAAHPVRRPGASGADNLVPATGSCWRAPARPTRSGSRGAPKPWTISAPLPGAVRPPRHPARRDRVLRDAAARARDQLRGAPPRGVRARGVWDFIGARTRSENYRRYLATGHDPLARRHARGREQHPDRRTHPAAALLRHPRAGRRLRPPAAGRPTTSGSIRGDASDRTSRRDLAPDATLRSVQSRR